LDDFNGFWHILQVRNLKQHPTLFAAYSFVRCRLLEQPVTTTTGTVSNNLHKKDPRPKSQAMSNHTTQCAIILHSKYSAIHEKIFSFLSYNSQAETTESNFEPERGGADLKKQGSFDII